MLGSGIIFDFVMSTKSQINFSKLTNEELSYLLTQVTEINNNLQSEVIKRLERRLID